MARKQLERSVGKKKTHSIYEDTFNRIQRNKEKRMELLKRMDDSKLEESTSSLDSEIALQTYLDTPDVQTCFICNEQLYGDLEAINLHIDNCLSNPSPTHNEPATTIMPTVSTSSPPSDDWQEYEWAGHRRVRATAMMEGGYGGAGFATTSKKEEEEGEEEDLDVEDDDAAQYGESQYTERDIVVDMDDENEDESALREMVSGGSIRTAISDRERDEFEEAVSIAGWNQHLNNESTNIKSKEDHSRLIIDSLKARIHELELNRSAHQCLICLEPYKTPVTSIICWHVHCEQCWLQTLGSKKLCPQCQKITTPSDLRRVYL
ncbi:hypothetical protein BDB01DRAFT_842206 [Pilobolus umbonatus]|nr:hypothetical protein BDB01DRAFT_842206 [Pilobolus umbonatus]